MSQRDVPHSGRCREGASKLGVVNSTRSGMHRVATRLARADTTYPSRVAKLQRQLDTARYDFERAEQTLAEHDEVCDRCASRVARSATADI